MASEDWEPSMLLLDLGHVSFMIRKTQGEVVAQSERRVVPSIFLHRPDRKTGPLWKLGGYELSGQIRRDVSLFQFGFRIVG
jgi:hypothetical protein